MLCRIKISIESTLNQKGWFLTISKRSKFNFVIVYDFWKRRHSVLYRAKLLNADWLRQRAFFLNHDLEGTFGNQERAWLLDADWQSTPALGWFPALASNGVSETHRFCLNDGKTLKVVLWTKFCPLCDKQVIALGQLRINFTCIFKVFQIWKYSWN